MDSKDGLRELIEMRNNKRNNGRGLLNNSYHVNQTWSDGIDKDRLHAENNCINNNGGDVEIKEEIVDPKLFRAPNHQLTSDSGENLATSNMDGELPDSHDKEGSDNFSSLEGDQGEINNEQAHDNHVTDLSDDDQLETSDSNLVPPNDEPVPMTTNDNQNVPDGDGQEPDPRETNNNQEIWTLPADRNVCTLEEIRRGQVINKTASNECPVLGCGKKINEMRIEPSPGTIASGLRTHVLFVHYGNRKMTKKRKLGWSSLKRRNQPSPKKHIGQKSPMSPTSSKQDFEVNTTFSQQPVPNLQSHIDLLQQGGNPFNRAKQVGSRPNLLDALQKLSAKQTERPSSYHNLLQITKNSKPKNNVDTTVQPKTSTEKLNPTTSSLFSILAGLTQQQQPNQQQLGTSLPRNIKTAQGTNTINISQCSRNPSNGSNNSKTIDSSLMSLLNERISNNVTSSLQAHSKKNSNSDNRNKISTSTMQSVLSPAGISHYPAINDNSSFNHSSSILNSLCSGSGDNRLNYDNSVPLNTFIESIAIKTGSNIGQAGIAEAKKILEKFTSSLICSSQTIADHYLAPFGGEVSQQKPEISPSDVLLAYKMMHKSHGQP